MSDPRPEHRLMLETLARIRALLASRAKMRSVERAGRVDALRAEVKRIVDDYDAATSDEAVRALRLGVPGRLRAVHHTITLPELPQGDRDPTVVRSGERGFDDWRSLSRSSIIADIRRFIDSARPTLDPNATLSSERPAETEVIYPRVAGPQRAEIGDELSVEATYTLHADDTASPPLTAPVRDGRVRVEVVAEATGALTLTSPAKSAIEGVPGKAPGGVTFHCRATRAGTGQVHVTFRAGGDTSTVTHSVMVFEAGALTERRRGAQSVERGLLYPTLPPAELELTARVMERGVDIELSDAHGILHVDGIATLDNATAEILRRAIYDGWRLRGQPSSARERQLGIIGANLARELLTQPLIDALQSQPAGHLRLRCTDPSLPWEMLRLGGPDGTPLGEAAAVARTPMRGRWGRPHRPGEVVLVSDTGRDVSGEHAALTALGFGEVSVMHSVDAFTARQLDRAPIGVLHFACHGDAEVDVPGSHALMFGDDGDLSPALILKNPDQGPLAGALVFVNACRGGHADAVAPGLVGHHAWAEAFLAAGAAAVIAPVCAVDDAEASAFAVAVYGALRDGHPVAEAVRRARCARAEAAPGRFERLAYVVYAPPGVRVSPAVSRAL